MDNIQDVVLDGMSKRLFEVIDVLHEDGLKEKDIVEILESDHDCTAYWAEKVYESWRLASTE